MRYPLMEAHNDPSVGLLHPDYGHNHDPQPVGPGHSPGQPAQATTRDNSIRSAYVHVLADTFVEVNRGSAA
jgi:hypothetical protein